MTEKTICKQCKKELKSRDDIGFLLLMTDPDTCPSCDGYDTGKWDRRDYVETWPCLKCIRTAIYCKECGKEMMIHQIKQYHVGCDDGALGGFLSRV